MFCYRPLMLSK